MSWTVGLPQDNWVGGENSDFFREVYQRHRCFGTFTWTPPSVAAGATSDTTLTSGAYPTIRGTRAGMAIHVTPPSTITAGLHVTGCWVATDNTITVRLYNSTGGAIALASATWAFDGVIV